MMYTKLFRSSEGNMPTRDFNIMCVQGSYDSAKIVRLAREHGYEFVGPSVEFLDDVVFIVKFKAERAA